MSAADSRVGIAIDSAPSGEHVSYVAGAITEILAAGAEHRTSESVMHAALDVLRQATHAAPVTVNNACVSMGDEKVTKFGTEMHNAVPKA